MTMPTLAPARGRRPGTKIILSIAAAALLVVAVFAWGTLIGTTERVPVELDGLSCAERIVSHDPRLPPLEDIHIPAESPGKVEITHRWFRAPTYVYIPTAGPSIPLRVQPKNWIGTICPG